LYPDPKLRLMMGWPIRWIAGFFSLLLVVAAAVPAYASEPSDPFRDGAKGSLVARTLDQPTGATLSFTAVSELIGSSTSASSEPEHEDDTLDVSPGPVAPSLWVVRENRGVRRPEPEVACPAAQPGRLSTRAPPRV
jgi:hypothetical protein